jgi:hypothetical protein
MSLRSLRPELEGIWTASSSANGARLGLVSGETVEI